MCLRGLLALQDGDLEAADRDFDRALEANPSLADAAANRGIIRFKRGDLDGALADLTRAASQRADAAILYNRGRVLEAQRRWQDAMMDYMRALQLGGGDSRPIEAHLDICRRALGTVEQTAA